MVTWYEQNKNLTKQRTSDRKKAISKLVREQKQGKSCTVCGESHIACLDFHHRDPALKLETPARLRNKGWSDGRILQELEKCDIICANCHRKIHYAGVDES